jgi:uncharacterized protein YcaQ
MRTLVPDKPLRISRRAARRFLVRRTGLGRLPGEARRRADADEVARLVAELQYVQVDPMRVLETNHDLVLAARLDGYTPDILSDLLYRQRRLVEVMAGNRCIVPAADYAPFRASFAAMERKYRPGLAELEPLMARALARIAAEGPLCSLDFEEQQRLSGWWDGDGEPRTRAIRQALEWLWHFGRLAISHRAGTRRYFDLPERLFGPQAAPCDTPDAEHDAGHGADGHGADGHGADAHGASRGADGHGAGHGAEHGADGQAPVYAELLRMYFRSMGLVDPRDTHFGWWRHKAPQRYAFVAEQVREGKLAPVEIEGASRPYYVPAHEVEALSAAGDLELAPDVAILPPLDNLVWLRSRTLDVFEFDYTWEAYVTPEKRQYGAYTCPILRGDRLVGRVDAAMDRKSRSLVVNGLWWAGGLDRSLLPEPDALATALSRLAATCGGESVADPRGILPQQP